MKRFAKVLMKVFIYIFATAALAGFLFGGVGGMFAVGRVLAPYIVIGGFIIYGLKILIREAEKAEQEENQSMNLARAMRDAKASAAASSVESGPIIP